MITIYYDNYKNAFGEWHFTTLQKATPLIEAMRGTGEPFTVKEVENEKVQSKRKKSTVVYNGNW